MAGTPSGRSVCCSIYGCNPLSCPQWRTYCKTCGLHCSWYRHEWKKRCPWNVCWRKRKRKVLAFYHEWIKKQRCWGYPDCMRWWFKWISTGNRGCLSQNRDSAVYHSPDPQFNEVCFIQRHQKTNGWSEACICSSNRRNSFKWVRIVQR